MIYKIEKDDGPHKLKKSSLTWILEWIRGKNGLKEDKGARARKRLAETAKQLDLARLKISQYQDFLSAVGRSKQEYEQIYEDALKAMNIAWQNYGLLRPQWEVEIDSFEKTVASLLTIQNELERYQIDAT